MLTTGGHAGIPYEVLAPLLTAIGLIAIGAGKLIDAMFGEPRP